MRSSAMPPGGIGTAWLFCTHSTTRSSSRAPAVRRSGRTARHWRRACTRGRVVVATRRCRARISPRHAGGTDRVDEKLAGEFRQLEAARAPRGCRSDAAWPGRHRLLPGRERRPSSANSRSHSRTRIRAVAGPVIGGDEPRGKPAGVAEEHEVGGEVQRDRDSARGSSASRRGRRASSRLCTVAPAARGARCGRRCGRHRRRRSARCARGRSASSVSGRAPGRRGRCRRRPRPAL